MKFFYNVLLSAPLLVVSGMSLHPNDDELLESHTTFYQGDLLFHSSSFLPFGKIPQSPAFFCDKSMMEDLYNAKISNEGLWDPATSIKKDSVHVFKMTTDRPLKLLRDGDTRESSNAFMQFLQKIPMMNDQVTSSVQLECREKLRSMDPTYADLDWLSQFKLMGLCLQSMTKSLNVWGCVSVMKAFCSVYGKKNATDTNGFDGLMNIRQPEIILCRPEDLIKPYNVPHRKSPDSPIRKWNDFRNQSALKQEAPFLSILLNDLVQAGMIKESEKAIYYDYHL